MTGCFVRLGCLGALVLALVVGWLTKDRWLPRVTGHRPAAVATAPAWVPVSDAGAERMRDAFQRLNSTRGPVFVTVTPDEVASYVFRMLLKEPKARADSVSARGFGDRVSIRANLQLSALKEVSSLGPLAALVGDRQRVELTGTLHVVKRGLAEFKVYELKIGDLSVPHALIPRVIRQLMAEPRPAGVAEDAVPFAIPNDMGDIRVVNGKIILYKTTK